MTDGQRDMTELCGWLSVIVALTTMWIIYGRDILATIVNMTDSGYDPFETKDQVCPYIMADTQFYGHSFFVV